MEATVQAPTKPTQKPSPGRIVRYIPEPNSQEAHNYAKEVPAMVVRVFGDGDLVNLKVFTDGPVDTWVPSAKYSEGKEPRTWHWPEIGK